MNAYFRELELLDDRESDMVEITTFGGPRQFISCGPTVDDYLAAAQRAYVRGDLSVGELEAEIERALQRAVVT